MYSVSDETLALGPGARLRGRQYSTVSTIMNLTSRGSVRIGSSNWTGRQTLMKTVTYCETCTQLPHVYNYRLSTLVTHASIPKIRTPLPPFANQPRGQQMYVGKRTQFVNFAPSSNFKSLLTILQHLHIWRSQVTAVYNSEKSLWRAILCTASAKQYRRAPFFYSTSRMRVRRLHGTKFAQKARSAALIKALIMFVDV